MNLKSIHTDILATELEARGYKVERKLCDACFHLNGQIFKCEEKMGHQFNSWKHYAAIPGTKAFVHWEL